MNTEDRETYAWSFSFGVMFGAAALCAFVSTGCASLMPVLDTVLDNARCAVEHQDLPTEKIVELCAIRPENIQHVLAILESSRKQGAMHANQAAAVQAEKDQRAGLSCK